MAKQTGSFFITGCFDNICFYRMGENYYARKKSSLDGKRVKKDVAFKETMRYARLLGEASGIAAGLYRHLPQKIKCLSLYRKLTGQAIRLLKDGKTKYQVEEHLYFTVKNV